MLACIASAEIWSSNRQLSTTSFLLQMQLLLLLISVLLYMLWSVQHPLHCCCCYCITMVSFTHLSGAMPSKPQNARFQANIAKWTPAAAAASKYSRFCAQAASCLTLLSSLTLQTALAGTFLGSWRAMSSSSGISCLAIVILLPLVLGSAASTSAQEQQQWHSKDSRSSSSNDSFTATAEAATGGQRPEDWWKQSDWAAIHCWHAAANATTC
jgi:hypothetical protein